MAGTAYEGTYIHKKDGHYYFFASIGSCCEGLKSTYTTVVGRSDNLFGPYVDKNGGSMMDNKHEVLIQKSNSFVGTGHNSEIVTDNAGNDLSLIHISSAVRTVAGNTFSMHIGIPRKYSRALRISRILPFPTRERFLSVALLSVRRYWAVHHPKSKMKE